MAEENDADQPGKLGERLDVNEATLELLQLRLENKVRLSLFKGIGLPLGSVGIVAILFGLLVVVPDKLNSLINQPEIQTRLESTVDKSVTDYLNKGEGSKQINKLVEMNL